MTEGLDRSHVTDVEHDLIVRFEEVVTLPVVWRGRIVLVYVGITGLQRLAIRAKGAHIDPSTTDDVLEIARRLELYRGALPRETP